MLVFFASHIIRVLVDGRDPVALEVDYMGLLRADS